jgi:hypothetical protein
MTMVKEVQELDATTSSAAAQQGKRHEGVPRSAASSRAKAGLASAGRDHPPNISPQVSSVSLRRPIKAHARF